MGLSFWNLWSVLFFVLFLLTLVKLLHEVEKGSQGAKNTTKLQTELQALKEKELRRTTSKRPVDRSTLWKQVANIPLTSTEKILRFWHEDWDDARIESALKDYRKLLYMFGIGKQDIVIVSWSPDVDEAWNAHIANLAQYLDDCATLFNEVLPHDEGQAGILGYREGNVHTMSLLERHFTVARNVPPVIRQAYAKTNMGEPWFIWWETYQATNQHDARKYLYNEGRHCFDPLPVEVTPVVKRPFSDD